MSWMLDEKFRKAENRDVVAFIERENPSAHDDVASMLTSSAKGMKDTQWYCPDVHAYAYVVLHTQGNSIFGIAFGMRGLAFCMPTELFDEAATEGGTPCPDIGADWILFDPFRSNLGKWCKAAHDHILKSVDGKCCGRTK